MRSRMSRRMCAALLLSSLTLSAAVLQSPTCAAEPAPLTAESLPQILTNLGYEPKDLRDGSWYVLVERTGYTLPVRCALSGDGSKLWYSAKLGMVDPDRLPSSVYRGLLSRDTGTARFYLCDCADCEKRTEKELFLSQPVENRQMTPIHLRAELDKFCASALRLEARWKPAVNKTQAPVPNSGR